MTSFVEQRNQSHWQSLAPKERVAQCTAMLQWTRNLISRQLIEEFGDMPEERLKWEVAKRLYGADPVARAFIDQRISDVSD